MAIDPIGRFCRVLRGLSKQDRKLILPFCSMAVGPHTTADYILPTVKTLRAQLLRLRDAGLREDFLIPGLFLYLCEFLRRRAAVDGREESLKVNGDILTSLRVQLALPPEQRTTGMSEAELVDLIEKQERHLSGFASQQENENRLIGLLETAQEERFPPEYWRRWRAI